MAGSIGRFLVTLALAAAGLVGCEQGKGFVHGDRLAVGSCREPDLPRVFEPFDMDLAFLGAVAGRQVGEDIVLFRASPSSATIPDADQFTFVLADFDQATAAIDAAGEAVLRVEDGDLTLGLTLLGTCPKATEAIVADTGEARFTSLGKRRGDRVVGVLEFHLVDQRTGDEVGTGFSAALDFDIESALPYQLFNNPNVQNPKL